MSLIVVTKRELGGNRATQLRRKGLVPMALIERTHNTVPIQAPVDDVRRALSHPDSHGRIEVQIEGDPTKRRAIIKQVEQDAIRHVILTITLQEVADDDMLRIDVPVVAVGTPKALEETSGTILSTPQDHVKIRGKVSDLPDHIEVDVSNLELGHHITAGDLKLSNGIELLTSPEAMLFVLAIVKQAPERAEGEPTEAEELAGAEGSIEAASEEG